MVSKSKEKHQKKNTKDNDLLNLDNEIIIGIKTLPTPEAPKHQILLILSKIVSFLPLVRSSHRRMDLLLFIFK